MKKLTDEKIIKLIQQKKDPIKYFIEFNKFLATKEHIGLSSQIDWVVTQKTAYELLDVIERTEKFRKE